jgi:hypothetical protein
MFKYMRRYVSVCMALHMYEVPASKPDVVYECITFRYATPIAVTSNPDEAQSELGGWKQLLLKIWGDGEKVE